MRDSQPKILQVNEPSIDGGARLKPENGLFVVGSALWPCGLGGTFSLDIRDCQNNPLPRGLIEDVLRYVVLPGIFAISVTPAIQGNYFVLANASLK